MKVVDRNRFEFLQARGDIEFYDYEWLDGYRIGLRLGSSCVKFPTSIDATNPDFSGLRPVRTPTHFNPGDFFLIPTVEKMRISTNLTGHLMTRSRWARMGVDAVGSSTNVGAGFGGISPISIILEFYSKIQLTNFPSNACVAAIILFEHPFKLEPSSSDHHNTFPLNIIKSDF